MVPPAQAETQDGAMSRIQAAYSAVLGAEHSGANVTTLDMNLTVALNLVNRGADVESKQPAIAQQYYLQADAIATQVASEAATLAGSGPSLAVRGEVNLVIELSALAVAALALYFLFPRLYWRVWTWINKDAKVSAP